MPTVTGEQLTVIGEVAEERNRQDAQWGGPENDDRNTLQDWHHYITRQMSSFWMRAGPNPDLPACRERLVKTAALAIAAIEAIDRFNQ
jgi:hypothetical protein